MTDAPQWQAPDSAPSTSGSVSGPAAPPPPIGAPLPSAPLGWTPPPKPGLIPLRPMTLGTILGASFQTLRRNPAATLGPALVLSLIVAVIQALGSAGFLSQYVGALSDYTDPTSTPPEGLSSGLISGYLGTVGASLGSGILSLVVAAIVQGIVTLQVASSTLGTRLRLAGLWRRLRGRRAAIIGWALLSGVVSLLAVVVVGGLLVLVGLTGPGGVAVAVLLGFVFFLGLFVAFAWLWVKLGFVPAILVLERSKIRAAMRRSWDLTRGAFWRLFGIRLLVALMIGVASSIITTPVALIFTLSSGVLAPGGATEAGMAQSLVIQLIVTQAITAVVSAVGLVISSAALSLLYLDQRMRTEGLDLDLARYVEHRQAGQQDLRDPYLEPERAPAGGGA